MKYRTFFLFILLSYSFLPEIGAQVLVNYDDHWQIEEQENWFDSNEQLSLTLDLVSFPQSHYSFRLPGEAVVFLGEKLWFFTNGDSAFNISQEEMRILAEKEMVDLTLFKTGVGLNDVSAKKLLKPLAFPSTAQLEEQQNLTREAAAKQDIQDFFIFALLLILVFVTLYKLAYPYNFAMMTRPISLLNAEDFSESGSLQKFFSFDILVFVLIVNLMTSLGLVLGAVLFQGDWIEARVALSFQNLLAAWLIGSIVLLILTILKFSGIRIFAFLFELNKIEFAHFFYLLRVVMIATFGLILISGYFLINDFYFAKSALGISFSTFFWFYILGVMVLFFIMMNRLSFKKYHLFTYLCIAELVPFLVIAKWVMVLAG